MLKFWKKDQRMHCNADALYDLVANAHCQSFQEEHVAEMDKDTLNCIKCFRANLPTLQISIDQRPSKVCPLKTISVFRCNVYLVKYSKMNILLPLETMAHDVTSQLQTKY